MKSNTKKAKMSMALPQSKSVASSLFDAAMEQKAREFVAKRKKVK
jgi:hypothetical protein